MKAVRFFAIALPVIAVFCAASQAQLLVEQFNYVNGPLVGNGVDGSHLWASHSGTPNQLQVLGGKAIAVQATQSEDVNVPVGITLGAGQKIYAAFDVTVGSTGALSGTSPAYFAHFKDAGTANFSGRVYAVPSTVGGDYTYGIRGGSGVGAAASWASGFTLGTTQRIVVMYEFGTGVNKLWIGPANEGSTSISDTVVSSFAISAFALREASYSTATGVTESVDSLCIDTTFDGALNCTPEPATAALLGFGVLTMIRRRR